MPNGTILPPPREPDYRHCPRCGWSDDERHNVSPLQSVGFATMRRNMKRRKRADGPT